MSDSDSDTSTDDQIIDPIISKNRREKKIEDEENSEQPVEPTSILTVHEHAEEDDEVRASDVAGSLG